MKQWILAPGADFSRLQEREVEQPQPGHGEVAVRVRATSLNYRDLITAENPKVENRVPLSDGAGEIAAVGKGVTGWNVGDRVCVNFFRDWQGGRFRNSYHDAALGGSVDGMLSEVVVFPAYSLVRIPDHFSFEEAATLPCAGLTAWCGLQRGHFVSGDTVLLQGTGGVSIWGLQIAVASGGRAIITSSSDAKLERAKKLGASDTINYKTTPDWEKEVWKLTNKQGVDHILEVGGPDTLGKSLASVSNGGSIAQIGVLTGFDAPNVSLFPIVAKNANINGIYVGDVESFDNFVRFLNVTKIQPIIDRVFPWEQTREAYDYMKSGAHFGKVVISV
ncbi:NAD(P)-dependent alcohol dehydrogenase [bacterium]|nr:MAG: NAD(P)-dependent alcohol dehydrogenase [bacterium]